MDCHQRNLRHMGSMAYVRAFSTLGSPELNLEQTLQLASRHDLAGVEIRALAGSMDLPALLAAAYGTPERFAATVRAQPVRIVALDTSLRLAGNKPADLEHFLRFVPWAEALGVPRLRVFDGGRFGDAAAHPEMAGTVSWWRRLRAENHWQTDIMVETHDALCSTEAVLGFLALAPRTGILWDTHHTWRQGGEDPVATWRAIRSHVVHMHVKDSVGIPSGKHPFSYCLPGDGEFPMTPLREIIRSEYTGPVSLEWERLWHPELAALEEALAAAAQRGWW